MSQPDKAQLHDDGTGRRPRYYQAIEGVQVSDPGTAGNPTWAALDTRVEGVVTELRGASTLDDLQDVERRCWEILIDAGRLLADPKLVPERQEQPKAGDAKAWLELFLAARASGRSHRELRAFIPVAWDLAQKVTHGYVVRVDALRRRPSDGPGREISSAAC